MDSAVKREIGRAVLIQGAWTGAFLVTLGLALAVALGRPELGAWRSAIMLAPLLPALGILRFVLRQFARSDEMHRRNQLVAVAAALGITIMLMVAYTLLEAVGWPRLPMWMTLMATQTVWMACIWIQFLRYR